MRIVLCLIIIGSRGLSPPLPSLGDTMMQIAKEVQSVVPPTDNTKVLEAITAQGLEEARSQVEFAQGDSLIERVVKTLVDARLNAHFLTGMCNRNYTIPCPTGWGQSVADVECKNPAGELVLNPKCASFNPEKYPTSALKAEFAIQCSAEWPCSACTRDFSNCPSDFEQSEEANKGLCRPKPTYLGPCTEIIDFRGTSNSLEKARWATRCYTEWPCSPE